MHPDQPPTLDAPPARQNFALEIHDTQAHLAIEPDQLRAWAAHTLRRQGIARAAISLTLVDDALIHALNVKYLTHDWPTDVISFPLSDPADDEVAGEIVISTETARTVALAAGADPLEELKLYLVHGLLHLCGFDDREPQQARLMHLRQAELLRELGGPPAGPRAAAGADACENGVPQWSD
jgi:probable rRNA maturation factor